MFYSQFILAKKGPLGTIWIAAHLERKLRKNQVADTDIGVSVDSILSPDVPIALRLSSHLLLGVVRIYSRKVNYLFHDCSEALLKVKQAFRSTAVDLPPEESTAPYHSITLPETFDLDDFELPDSDNFQGNFVDHHVSTREQITLQDSMDGVVYSTSQFGLDERFGDGDTSQIGLDLDEELMLDKVAASGQTAALLDPDNLDPEASGQPMTPYMEMDIDDDDITGEESPVVMLGPKDANTDANAQNETVVNNPALCGNQIQSLNFDGHGLPIELFPSTDPSPQSTQQAPYTPGLVEEAYPTTIHFSEDTTHGPVNKTSLFNSEEVISNPLYEAESHAPKFVAEEIIQNNTSEESFHNRGTNEAGDSISVNNKNSETDVSHLPQDVEKINIADTNSIPSDVGHKVSSPTSVLAEQLKPTSPSSGILDRAPALPDITDKTQKNERVSSENPSSSDVGPIHAEVFPEASMTENAALTSVLMETSNEPLQSNEGVSVNPTLTDVSQTIKEDMLEHVCVSQMAFPGPHNSGDLTECTRHDVNPPLVSEATHHFDKEESRGCLGSEVREMQPSVSPDEVISEPRLGLRPCSSVLKQPDTVVLADRNVALNATDLSLTEADLQSSSVLGNVDPDNANGISVPVQGVDFQPTSTRDTFLVSNIVSESVRSNGQEAGFSTVDRAIYTVNSRDQLGNLNFTAGFDLAVPQPERLFSAPEAVPLGVSTVDGTLHTVSSKDQLGNLNFAAGFDLSVPQTERLFSAPEAVPFGASSVDGALHAASSKDQLGNLNFTAGFDLTVPQTERLFSAPETVPFGVSTVDRASYTVSSKDQLGNLNFRAGFDLAVPQTERMLSAPEAVPFGGGYFPVQSTHGKNVSREREVREIEFNTLAGKKRQQMETTPIEQYSSSELPWMLSNKAFGSIPDDYDVLSSILVGRKSSALKLKPTPQQPDTSKKRQRMTPRTSVAKRKVLMDDTMVLHGDTIRLQLTSTEDIRRVRKKAPCTRPEIWMIQKHLLEDDIFVEPLFTGMSPDLIGMHNRTYNAVIDVRVSEKSVNNMLPEVPKDVLIQKNTDFSGKGSREDTVQPVPIEDEAAVNGPMQTHIQIDNQSSEMAVSNLLPEIPEEVLIQKNTDFSGNANREETVEPVPVDDGGAIHEPTQTHKNTDFSGKAYIEEGVEPVSVDDGSAIHEPMKTHIQIANRFSDEHLHPTELDTQEQTRPHSDPAPADLQNGQLDINVSMEIDIGSGDVVGEYPLVAGTMSENRCDETVGFENESLPVDGGNGVDIVEQNGGNLDIQSIENDVAFMEKNNCRADYTVHTANANEEGVLSAHDVLMENGEPAQEIFESDTLKGLEQNIESDHHFDVCNGCSPHIDINCVRDDKADVPSDAFAPMTNDKPLSSNISVGSEGSTDPTIVINDAKEGIRSDTELIVGENASESIRDDAHNSPSGLVPLEELSCPPSELNLARESDTYIERENVGMQEAALEGSVDARNMSSQVASLAMRIGDEPTLVDNASKSNDLEDEHYENDTEFLNFDDDDDDGAAIEEEDNNVPEAEEADEAGTLDNSGWSSRTRGVAKYLQTLFDAERGRGRKNLSMDNLLSGKTRKEASRMFFETLVLTTRDYVLVEQQNPFDNINIKPRGKLMKSEF